MTFAVEVQQRAITGYMIGGHPLHQRSGNLIKALNVAPVKSTDKEISTTVGDNIAYAWVHEMGGTFNIPAHMRHISRTRARALGYDTSKLGKGYRIEDGMVKAHTATYPKRAFLAPALADKAGDFVTAMDAAVSEAAEATNESA